MCHHRLHISLRRADRHRITRGAIHLEPRRDRKTRPRRRRHQIGLAAGPGRGAGKAWIVIKTQVPLDLRVGVGACGGQYECAKVQVRIHFDTANAGVRAVMDLGEAVLAEEGELEAFPILLIDRTVETQLAAQQRRLPAHFVIGEIVGLIGRNIGAPVDAARAIAARPGRIEQNVLHWLPGEVQAVGEALPLLILGNDCAIRKDAEIGAGAPSHRRGQERGAGAVAYRRAVRRVASGDTGT